MRSVLWETYVVAGAGASVCGGAVRVVCLRMRLRFCRYLIDAARDQNQPIKPAEILKALKPGSQYILLEIRREAAPVNSTPDATEERRQPSGSRRIPPHGTSADGPTDGQEWRRPSRYPAD